MDKKINEYSIQIIGKSYLPEKLELSHDYNLNINVNIVSATAKDNQDGTIDLNYKAKLITSEIIDDKGVKIKSISSKKWSQSQKLRFAIENINEELKTELDSEKFYEIVTNAIMNNLPDIIIKYIKL